MILPADPVVYLTPLALLTLIASLVQIRKNEVDLHKRRKEIEHKIYEVLVFREISERIGYELDMAKMLDTIVGSLNKLIPYSAAGYLLTTDNQTHAILRFHLEESVSRAFLDGMRVYMLDTLTKMINHGILVENIAESLTGAIVDEGQGEVVSSLWVAPLSLNNESFGVLAIASKKHGLYRGEEMEILNKILSQANKTVANLRRVIAMEQEKLNAMVAAIADGVLMLDQNLGLLVINPAAVRLLDLPADKKPTVWEIISKLSDKIDLRARIDESLAGNKLVVVENLTVGERASTLLISPVKDSKGKILGVVILFQDVTAQRELERIREEFTAMMVHELRAPLTVVRGATDMILRDRQIILQPQGQELLKSMASSASTMLSLVNDLLDAAKIEAGKFQIIKTGGDLGEIINDRLLFFSQLASQKAISLSAEQLEPNLVAMFDRDRLMQVLGNLLSNAIKFTPIEGKITVSAYHIDSPADIKWRFKDSIPNISNLKVPAVLVSISDTGIGMNADQLSQLFSKFRQLHGGSSNGTGLGLVISKGIIESHGGSIFVQSRPNEGSTFYFTIPLE